MQESFVLSLTSAYNRLQCAKIKLTWHNDLCLLVEGDNALLRIRSAWINRGIMIDEIKRYPLQFCRRRKNSRVSGKISLGKTDIGAIQNRF